MSYKLKQLSRTINMRINSLIWLLKLEQMALAPIVILVLRKIRTAFKTDEIK